MTKLSSDFSLPKIRITLEIPGPSWYLNSITSLRIILLWPLNLLRIAVKSLFHF